MVKGSCCCGGVQFELAKDPTSLGFCHCTRCRKTGASALVFINKEDLKWIKGKELLQAYKAVPPYKYDRYFCSNCGTHMGEILADMDSFPISANLLDEEIGLKNKYHEFVDEKPSWDIIGDDAKQFPRHPDIGSLD